MKQDDIQAGKFYADDKGAVREVVLCYGKEWPGCDTVRYCVIQGRGQGICKTITKAAFAGWAKMRLPKLGPPIKGD